ncbi:hypothetical protein pb186bvf_008280 [Paramecium bursaria]
MKNNSQQVQAQIQRYFNIIDEQNKQIQYLKDGVQQKSNLLRQYLRALNQDCQSQIKENDNVSENQNSQFVYQSDVGEQAQDDKLRENPKISTTKSYSRYEGICARLKNLAKIRIALNNIDKDSIGLVKVVQQVQQNVAEIRSTEYADSKVSEKGKIKDTIKTLPINKHQKLLLIKLKMDSYELEREKDWKVEQQEVQQPLQIKINQNDRIYIFKIQRGIYCSYCDIEFISVKNLKHHKKSLHFNDKKRDILNQ